jgi:hypothetical protein
MENWVGCRIFDVIECLVVSLLHLAIGDEPIAERGEYFVAYFIMLRLLACV